MRMQLLYMGYSNYTDEIQQAFNAYDHMLLVTNTTLRNRIISYLNVSQIPLQYRNQPYYAANGNPILNTEAYKKQLSSDHIFVRDQHLAKLVLQLFAADVSPLLADSSALVGMPPALFIVSEKDQAGCKDTSLLYAQRLIEAGSDVTVKVYMDGTHGGFGLYYDNNPVHFVTAVSMYNDLFSYLREKL